MQIESQNNLICFNRTCHHYKGVVFSSQAIFMSLGKFGLTPAEFLRPFFNLSTKVRMKLGLKEKVLENFQIDLLDQQEFQATTREISGRQVKETLRDFAPSAETVEITSRWQHRSSVDQMVDANRTPWFHQNQQSIADFSSYSYHLNFLDQPLVLVYVVSGQEQDPVKEVIKIKQDHEKFLRTIFANNIQDIDQVKKFILVLNDAQVKMHFVQEEKMRKEFQHHMCKVMPYNLPIPIQANLWIKTYRKRSYIEGQQSKQPIMILDEPAIKSYKNQFEEVLQYQILPQLERTVNILTQQNIETRKKPIDTIFNFLKRNDSQKGEADYIMSQREYLLRYLGDMNFLLSEYDQAADYYKALSSELKSNKTRTTLPALNCLEFQCYAKLCSENGVLGRLNRKDKDELLNQMEEIQAGYIAERQPAQVLKLAYFFIYTINIYQRYQKETNYFLSRTNKYLREAGSLSKPDHLINFQTQIFEQIAFLYLRQEPPQFRKFAHNLTLVASRYENEGFRRNSLRCYRIVETIYRESQWLGILNWLQCHLGANYFECDKISQGIDCFKYALNLANDRQQIETHNQLAADWKKAFTSLDPNKYPKANTETFSQTKLQVKIPNVKGLIDIILEDDKTYILDNKVSTGLPSIQNITNKQSPIQKKSTELWGQLSVKGSTYYEDQLLKSMDSVFLEEKIVVFNKVPCVINPNRVTDIQDRYSRFGRQSFVNEPIQLRIPFNSYLKMPHSITNLQVTYEFYSFEQQIQNSNLLQIDEDISPIKQASIISVKLPPQQLVNFTFNQPKLEYVEAIITPSIPGFLTITGLSWEILDIPTTHQLNYDLKDQSTKKSVNFFNKFHIFPEYPQLQLSLDTSLDPEIYYGEMRPIKIRIKNIGKSPILKIELVPLVSYHFGFKRIVIQKNNLQPQEEITQDIYIRCSYLEPFTAKLLVKYQVDQAIYRYTRMFFPMQAKSSFKINLQSYQNIESWRFTLIVQEYFKGLIKNGASLRFNQIICINENWKPAIVHNQEQSFIQQSNEELFIFITVYLKKLQNNLQINNKIFKNRSECFIYSEDIVNTVELQKGPELINNATIYNFINEDVRFYFNSFFNYDPNNSNFEFPLFLIVLWNFIEPETNRSVVGMHEVPFTSQHQLYGIQKSLASLAELPISIQINTQEQINHDFKQISYLQVPVQVKLKNSKFPYRIKFKLEFINGDEPLRSTNDTNDPAFIWTGSSFLILELDALQEETVEQTVIFLASGVYDISRVKITFFHDQGTNINKQIEVKEYYSQDYEQLFIRIN